MFNATVWFKSLQEKLLTGKLDHYSILYKKKKKSKNVENMVFQESAFFQGTFWLSNLLKLLEGVSEHANKHMDKVG